MKKKIILSILTFIFLSLNVMADNFPDIKYRNIKVKDSISFNQQTNKWSNIVNRKNDLYFTKIKGFGDSFDYIYPNKDFAFTTNCEYEFIYLDNLIGYSNKDLKFYEFIYANGRIIKRALDKEEVQKILPNYLIISISDFNKNTNAYKLKKHFGELKILVYNDSDQNFNEYQFSSGNSKIKIYNLNGFLSVDKPGMIQFSASGEYSPEKPCYVILVR